MQTDPIADMLTRIRNGGRARLARVKLPKSRLKTEIARVLRENGYISGFGDVADAAKPTLSIEIRYGSDDLPIIEGLERISRPGRRVYVPAKKIPQIRSGLGIAIVSTPRGVMSDTQAREAGLGGELLAKVW
ncbi:MAG TPA: 30S ribosomal protein S8 [Myxococcota bacterium]|jgi:small subunit ribosomal protein S8|nr:30S ribosomal protein S8 [Myxococcota bacterium]